MTYGLALSDGERQYIRDHISDGPARIAFDLGREFREINGGFRKRDTVKKFIRRIRAGTPIVIEIPAGIAREAREKGVSEDMIRFVALRAILKRVRAPG